MILKDYIEALELPWEIRTETLSSLHEHFKAKHFTAADVLEFYRQRDSSKFVEAVKIFEKGKLFRAQMQSYESWSAFDYFKDDEAVAELYLSLEDSAQMKKGEGTPENIRRFIFTRVYGARPRSTDTPERAQKIKEIWISQNKRFNWNWNP